MCPHTPSALNAGAKRSGATCHMAMPQCCYLAKGAKRPSHATNTIKFDRIPFDPCNSSKRFNLCPFDQKNSTYLQPPEAAYVPVLLGEAEQQQRPSEIGDREAIVVGAGLCDVECERAYTGCAPHFIRNVSANVFSRRRFGIFFFAIHRI